MKNICTQQTQKQKRKEYEQGALVTDLPFKERGINLDASLEERKKAIQDTLNMLKGDRQLTTTLGEAARAENTAQQIEADFSNERRVQQLFGSIGKEQGFDSAEEFKASALARAKELREKAQKLRVEADDRAGRILPMSPADARQTDINQLLNANPDDIGGTDAKAIIEQLPNLTGINFSLDSICRTAKSIPGSAPKILAL